MSKTHFPQDQDLVECVTNVKYPNRKGFGADQTVGCYRIASAKSVCSEKAGVEPSDQIWLAVAMFLREESA